MSSLLAVVGSWRIFHGWAIGTPDAIRRFSSASIHSGYPVPAVAGCVVAGLSVVGGVVFGGGGAAFSFGGAGFSLGVVGSGGRGFDGAGTR